MSPYIIEIRIILFLSVFYAIVFACVYTKSTKKNGGEKPPLLKTLWRSLIILALILFLPPTILFILFTVTPGV